MNTNKINVCVLFGGVSPEHDISLRSAETVLSNIDREKYNVFPVGITKGGDWIHYCESQWHDLPTHVWESSKSNKKAIISPTHDGSLIIFSDEGVKTVHIDVLYPVLHGENGEDGSIQGLAQLANLPCVGPDLCASAVSMDKAVTKIIAKDLNVPQADWYVLSRHNYALDETHHIERIEKQLQYPVFVKPARTGSSVGVTKAKNRDELINALNVAFEYDNKLLVEEFIKGREIEVAVLGNQDPIAPVCGEIESGVEFYDFDAKYLTSTSTTTIPAKLSKEVSDRVRNYAIEIYSGIGCAGLSRVDFFVTEDNDVYFNEINTLPGFTSVSMYPKMLKYHGIEIQDLISSLIELAIQAKD